MGLFGWKKKKETKQVENEKKAETKKTNATVSSTSSQKKKIEKEQTAPKTTKKTVKNSPEKNDKQKTNTTKVKASKVEDKERKTIYRVVYDKDARSWLIKKDGAKRTIASFPTKEEAMSRVKELSESQDINFVVHKKDGKFQKK